MARKSLNKVYRKGTDVMMLPEHLYIASSLKMNQKLPERTDKVKN